MKTYSKQEFVDWCLLQGHRPFNGENGNNCAMTQFGKAMDSRVDDSACHSDVPGLNAILYTSDNGYNRRPVGHIDLTNTEVHEIINSHNFVEAAERIA